jgi:hypothetical protein
MVRHPYRIISTIALSLALAAAAAPAALAKFELNPAPSPPQITGTCSETCSGAGYLTSHATLPPSTINRASEVVSGGGYGPSSIAPTVIHVSTPSSAFDWGDAGIGAGGALALMSLAAGGVLILANSRRRTTRAPGQPTT